MQTIVEKRINWKKTLLGLQAGESIIKKKPSPQNVSLVRNWASVLKKTGCIYKVSLQGTTLTIKREL